MSVVIQPVSKLFTDDVDYCNYWLKKKSTRYDDDLANELSKMNRKTAVKMKYRTFNEKDPLPIIFFPQVFKAAYSMCNIH